MAIAPVKVIVSTRLKLGVSAHYANEHRQDKTLCAVERIASMMCKKVWVRASAEKKNSQQHLSRLIYYYPRRFICTLKIFWQFNKIARNNDGVEWRPCSIRVVRNNSLCVFHFSFSGIFSLSLADCIFAPTNWMWEHELRQTKKQHGKLISKMWIYIRNKGKKTLLEMACVPVCLFGGGVKFHRENCTANSTCNRTRTLAAVAELARRLKGESSDSKCWVIKV